MLTKGRTRSLYIYDQTWDQLAELQKLVPLNNKYMPQNVSKSHVLAIAIRRMLDTEKEKRAPEGAR